MKIAWLALMAALGVLGLLAMTAPGGA